jgi:hypothetical protein
MAGPRIQRFSSWGKLYDVGEGAKAVFLIVLSVVGGAKLPRRPFWGRGPKTTGTVPARSRTTPNALSAGRVFESPLAIADFEAITTVDGLDVEDVFRGKAQHALDGSRYVLVHSVGELNHDDGAFTRRSNQTTGDSSRASTKLPQHDLHDVYSSNLS